MSASARRGTNLRRASSVVAAVMLTLAVTACLPGQDAAAPPTSGTQTSTSTPTPSTSTTGTATPTPAPTTTTPTTPTPTRPTPKPTPTKSAEPAPVILFQPGDHGPKVRALQARLRQINWFEGNVTDYFGPRTTAAVKGFQAKRGFPVTGKVDQRTWDRLVSMTHRPTADELNNVTTPRAPISWDVDRRCLTGRVICISKSTRELTWVINGVPQYDLDVRFGSDELPTREGTFSVYKKKVDVISNLYHTPMPYSIFFSGGQAVHYSSNFARLGYSGTSHGCVNVRDWDGMVRLYNDVRIGDTVVVHW